MGLAFDLSPYRALVTGAGQGLGRAIATRLAESGAEVLVNDLVSARSDAVTSQIVAAGGRAQATPFDVTDWPTVRDTLADIAPVDVVVNNAGSSGDAAGMSRDDLAPFSRTQPTDWDPFLRVNLYGVMHVVRATMPAMIEAGWGRVITIISDAARVGEPNLAAYAAAKAGAAGFSRSIAREVGRHGITVNCVSLGTMRRPGQHDPNADTEQARLKRYPIRRRGEPDDAAALVTYLASPLAGWITGQTYPVNGGYSSAL